MLKDKKDSSLKIELIKSPEEIEYYSDILTRHHYLCSSQCNRNTIMHVARKDGEDIAILTWEPKVRLWFSMRDKLIGWTKEDRSKRLKYCVENRRFLMLTEEKNVASQTLALSIRRLCKDGKKVFGHEFLLAETFVDPSRGYKGICYKAAGWREVGLTCGGRGKVERSRKLYFVKELKKDAILKLKAPNLTPSDTINPRQSVLFLEKLNLQSLRKKLENVKDYRKIKGKNPLAPMLVLILVAMLGGKTNCKEIYRWISSLSMEVLRNVGCRKKISYTTLWRVLTNVNNEELSKQLCSWLIEQGKKIHVADNLKVICLDGKTLRSASKTAGTAIQVLSLMDTAIKVLFAQYPITRNKEHEISMACTALEKESIPPNTIFTADALHTQRKTAEIIKKKTVITSCRSKGTNRIYKKRYKKQKKRHGQYHSVLQSLIGDV